MKKIKRRDFIKWGTAGTAGLIVASKLPVPGMGDGKAHAATHILSFDMTDGIKQMHTHIPRNTATCYFWLFKSNTPNFLPAVPGPHIVTTQGDSIQMTLSNDRNASGENLGFAITKGAGIVVIDGKDFGLPAAGIAPGGSGTLNFPVPAPGTYLYYAYRPTEGPTDPVPRAMGLHGALVVMPSGPHAGPKLGQTWGPYPYNGLGPTHPVAQLFNDLGDAVHWPGLKWHEADPGYVPGGPPTAQFLAPPYRQCIWLTHQASPVLFAEVGNNANITGVDQNGVPYSGSARDPEIFLRAFLADAPIYTSNDGRANTPKLDRFNRKPHFFTINGQSGHFSHNHATITPMYRVGEPTLIRVVNAGLYTHSMHLHANHYYLLSVNGEVKDNLLWLDVYQLFPMDIWDMLIPLMRSPDVPNVRAIGRPDTPLMSTTDPGPPGFPGAVGHPVWPPVEEFTLHHPKIGTIKRGFLGGRVDIAQRQSPLCYPMHSHLEPDQSTQGGNYNTALISGMYLIGDQNLGPTPADKNFPIDEDFEMMLLLGPRGFQETGPAAGNEP